MDDRSEPERAPQEAQATSDVDYSLTAREIIAGVAETYTWVLLAAAMVIAMVRGNIEMALLAGAGLIAWLHYLLQRRDRETAEK